MTVLILGRIGGFAERRAARRARRAHRRTYHREMARHAKTDPDATAPMPAITAGTYPNGAAL
jgi:hypothetical protein